MGFEGFLEELRQAVVDLGEAGVPVEAALIFEHGLAQGRH